MTHKILDNKADKEAIESFELGSDVNLNCISLGTQIYYLYKEEDDATILSWYWGCVIEINRNRKNNEYYHIWHDDENPWIDLSSDRNDWRLIPENNHYYDTTFDLKRFSKTNKKKKKTKRKQKKTKKSSKPPPTTSNVSAVSNKRYGVGNQGFASIVPKTPISCTITDGPILSDGVRLQSSSSCNSYSFWVRKEDIKQVLENEKLMGQRVAFELNGKTSRYKIIEIDQEKEFVKCYWQKNINQTWVDMNNFHTKLTSVSLSDTSSPTPQNTNSSNKENEDEDEERLMISTSPESSADVEMNGSSHKKRGRPKGSRNKKTSSRKKRTNSISSVKSESINIESSEPPTKIKIKKSANRSRQIRKHKVTLNMMSNSNTNNNNNNNHNYSLSQPINRNIINDTQQRKNQNVAITLSSRSSNQRQRRHSASTTSNNTSNTIHSGQVSSDIVRYQRLQNQRFYNNPRRMNTASSFPLQTNISNRYINNISPSIPTATATATTTVISPHYLQPQYVHSYNNNAFQSPLARRTHFNASYSYQQQPVYTNNSNRPPSISSDIGQKRQRSNDLPSLLPPNKRQRLNNNSPQQIQSNTNTNTNTNNSNNSNNSILRLVAIQPPQPENDKMPELQSSATPKAKKTSLTIKCNNNNNNNDNNNIQSPPFPNPSVSTLSSPAVDNDNNNNNNKKKQYPTADEVSSRSVSVASGVHSESPKIVANQTVNKGKNIGINVDVETNTRNHHRNEVASDTESENTILSHNDDIETRRKNGRNNNHNHNKRNINNNDDDNNNGDRYNQFCFYDGNMNKPRIRRHVLSEPPPNKSSQYQLNDHHTPLTMRSSLSSPSHSHCHSHDSPTQQFGYYHFAGNQQQYINKQYVMPMYFPMISLEHITNKLTDKNISNEERIESLKNVVRYLTNCQNTMSTMWKQIGFQCDNVIRCVEGIIQDLQQRS